MQIILISHERSLTDIFNREEEVDLDEGSQYLIRYNAVKDLLESGSISLI